MHIKEKKRILSTFFANPDIDELGYLLDEWERVYEKNRAKLSFEQARILANERVIEMVIDENNVNPTQYSKTTTEYRIVKRFIKDAWGDVKPAYVIQKQYRFLLWKYWGLLNPYLYSTEEYAIERMNVEIEYDSKKNIREIVT